MLTKDIRRTRAHVCEEPFSPFWRHGTRRKRHGVAAAQRTLPARSGDFPRLIIAPGQNHTKAHEREDDEEKKKYIGGWHWSLRYGATNDCGGPNRL